MKINFTPCFILHRRNFSETSFILEIFSRDYGRVSIIAKGAKKGKKYQGVNFDLYQKYNVSWISRNELGTLTGIDILPSEYSFVADKAITGFYINEIILKLLYKDEPHPELFDMYELTLNRLFSSENEKIILRYFEKILLQSLGYGVLLDHDVETGQSIIPTSEYYYKIDSGPSLEISSGEGIKISGKTLCELDNETLTDVKNINEAKGLLSMILKKHISQPLESRRLYKSYANIKN